MVTSNVPGFYKMTPEERLDFVKEFADLDQEDVKILSNTGAMKMDEVDRMIENVIGTMPLPLGIATNFLINGKDYMIPMALEEPSVVAAASNAGKMAREKGGFNTSSTPPLMIGQIQLTNVEDAQEAKRIIEENKEEILRIANEMDPILLKVGGGAKDVQVRVLETIRGPMVVAHLIVDCRDAMGANAVNTMAEGVAPFIERLTKGRVYLRIISNLADLRIAKAEAVFGKGEIGGEEVVDGILEAYAFAAADPYRAATHNKGVMNGISAVVIATGNDFRAVESGAHSYASITGRYGPLTKYEKNEDGDLVGRIEIPMAVGLVGGATAVHPTARRNVKILGVKTASELGEIIAAVGLAQNFAALRALATEGIQRGHMSLHARNIAVTVGAEGEEVEKIVERLVAEKKVRMDRAEEILKELRGES
ncbi:MAG: hydroxymethylglutaryl-CoA reductase, degradative [Methanobacteriota archaeon]|nr:MAG: hydroxymethylglutaryl-CoA reductase, degradative [Euryarchaeota archaeon]UCD93329.1 MAG: hydroxymethylglutaryl-CoA reductase, degradative [Euryarchaeota archaeon]